MTVDCSVAVGQDWVLLRSHGTIIQCRFAFCQGVPAEDAANGRCPQHSYPLGGTLCVWRLVRGVVVLEMRTSRLTLQSLLPLSTLLLICNTLKSFGNMALESTLSPIVAPGERVPGFVSG